VSLAKLRARGAPTTISLGEHDAHESTADAMKTDYASRL
jgi:hypothetical protein